MNELARIDKNMSVDRTPEVIALEINNITETLRKIFLLNAIEIGRRLAEAKIMVGHGEWGNWLKESFDYSQRTASDLMLVFEEYGSSQMVIFCDNVKSQAFANLSVTKAILLARGISAEEREEFIENNDINSMSTRELQKTIKEKQELEAKMKELEIGWAGTKKLAEKAKRLAESEKKTAEEALRTTEAIVEKLQNDLQEEKDKSQKEIDRLSVSIEDTKRLLAEAKVSGNDEEVERLSESLVKTDSELCFANQKIEELERQLKEPIEVTAAPVVEKIPEEVEKELNELRERTKELEAKVAQPQPVNTASVKFKIHFESLVDEFKDILSVLEEIDSEEQGKYRSAVRGLIGKMLDRLVAEG